MALTKITSRILDSSGVTILGTIATGVWQGTAINQTYLVGQSGTNTGDETLARINALDVTELGTVSSGVWNGTAIASAYLDADTAHLSTTQTFTGAKTFSSTVTTGGAIANPFKITANPGTRSLKLTSASTNFGTWISWLRGNETYEKAYLGFTSTSDDVFEVNNRENADMTFHTNTNERVRILAGGNVGIGTSSPGQKLVIGGGTNGRVRIKVTEAVNNFGKFEFSTSDSATSSATMIAEITAKITQAHSSSLKSDLSFSTNSGDSLTERMHISSGGDVNIGTSDGLPLMHGSVAGNASYCSYSFVGDPNTGMIRTGADTLALVTGASPRLTISSGGQIFMNTNSSFGTGVLSIQLGGTNKALGIRFRAASNGNFATGYENSSGTLIGKIIMNASSTSYETTSDYRLKENVTTITDALSRVNQLKPSRYNFIADSDKTLDGFLAHEVQDIIPEAISGEKDALNEDGTPNYQGIDQSKIVPLLTAAIQEQQTIIEDLKLRIETLEG